MTSSSPPVSAAVARKVIRSPVAGFSTLSPARATSARKPLDEPPDQVVGYRLRGREALEGQAAHERQGDDGELIRGERQLAPLCLGGARDRALEHGACLREPLAQALAQLRVANRVRPE